MSTCTCTLVIRTARQTVTVVREAIPHTLILFGSEHLITEHSHLKDSLYRRFSSASRGILSCPILNAGVE